MKKYKVIVTDDYVSSHEQIISYLRNTFKDPIVAERYKKLFDQALDSLEDLAGGLPIIDNEKFRHLKLRKIRVKHFSILFFVNDELSTAYVVNIVHNSSDWQNRLI